MAEGTTIPRQWFPWVALRRSLILFWLRLHRNCLLTHLKVCINHSSASNRRELDKRGLRVKLACRWRWQTVHRWHPDKCCLQRCHRQLSTLRCPPHPSTQPRIWTINRTHTRHDDDTSLQSPACSSRHDSSTENSLSLHVSHESHSTEPHC